MELRSMVALRMKQVEWPLKQLSGLSKKSSSNWVTLVRTRKRSIMPSRCSFHLAHLKSMSSKDWLNTSKKISTGWSGFLLPMQVTLQWVPPITFIQLQEAWWAPLTTEITVQIKTLWISWATTRYHQILRDKAYSIGCHIIRINWSLELVDKCSRQT